MVNKNPLIFSHLDLVWVKKNIMEVVENSGRYRLCLHERDFEPGAAIISNITTAINHSRRIIMVLSRYVICPFMQTVWSFSRFFMIYIFAFIYFWRI